MDITSLDQLDVKGKKLLIRVDYNVPLDGEIIKDDNRVRQSLPTLQYGLDHGAALILCSHLGGPKGRDPKLSLAPVARHLEQLLGRKVLMAPDCVGPEVRDMAGRLKAGEILVLENLRFHPEEKANDETFAKELASLADIYVSDAFGAAHRAHASVAAITKFASSCCVGLLMKKELEYLGDALQAPKRPFVGIFGGAKVSTKLAILNTLLGKVDRLLIGGAMANTFIKALGYPVGKSLVEDDLLDAARKILDTAREKGVSVYLPVDFVLGADVKADRASGTVAYQDIPEDLSALDIGPATRVLFAVALADAATVVWNGPMGAFENPVFVRGSESVAETLAGSKGLTIVGGGDTDAVLHQAKLDAKMDFISTGGGSFMEFMEGKELPAVTALKECSKK